MERKKITRSEEFKKRVGDFHRGKTVSEETRRKISEANKGKPSPRKGCHLSEETKEKLRIANLGKKLSEEQKASIRSGVINSLKYHNFNFRETVIEKRVREQLDKYNIKYHSQKSICNGHFVVDFYLPEYQLVIECNGSYWHKRVERVFRDIELEEYVLSKGKDILWLWDYEINDEWFDISDYLEV